MTLERRRIVVLAVWRANCVLKICTDTVGDHGPDFVEETVVDAGEDGKPVYLLQLLVSCAIEVRLVDQRETRPGMLEVTLHHPRGKVVLEVACPQNGMD
jgi:hypothetical protein